MRRVVATLSQTLQYGTPLAEAEIEYHDHTSHTIWVRFPVVHAAAQIGRAHV